MLTLDFEGRKRTRLALCASHDTRLLFIQTCYRE